MSKRFREWLTRKWSRDLDARQLAEGYRVTFSTLHGQLVLQHLLDSVYCQVYEGNDSFLAGQHIGARRVVHTILLNIDVGEHPEKYDVTIEDMNHAR
jgi:hypothetical protein